MTDPRLTKVIARVAIEQDGLLLCAQHSKPPGPAFWCLPGGKVDEGETAAEAAIRELREEASIEIDLEGVIAVQDSVERCEIIFRGRIASGEASLPPTIADRWLQAIAWHPRDELPGDFLPQALRDRLLERPLASLPSVPFWQYVLSPR